MRISDWSSDVCSSDLAIAMALCTLISSANAADQTCKAKAIKQKLAGEALLNFVKQCETNALMACANKTAGKPDLMDACVANALGVGPRWCRSEERRVGKEWVRRCGYRWWPDD